MKKYFPKYFLIKNVALSAMLTLLAARTAQADQIKANNAISLDQGGSWVSGTAPGSGDWAIWDGTYAPSNCTNAIDNNVTWGGILISNVSGAPVEITGTPTMTIAGLASDGGVVGIDMSSATVDLTIGTGRLNISQNQSWNVASGRTFTWAALMSPYAFNLNNGPSYNLTLNGGGNYMFDGNLYDDPLNAIVTMNSTGACTLAAANYVNHWMLNSGTLNIDNAYAVSGRAGSTLTINGGTIDNTSGAAIALGNGPSFNWNGNFTFAGTADMDFGSGSVTLGPNVQETVAAGALTVGGAIGDNGNGFGLTKAGAGTLLLTSLSGVSTYTGDTIINGGTLAILNSGSLSSSAILVGNGTILDVSAAGWSGNGSQALGGASTSGTGTINAGVQPITLTVGDGLSFQAAGGSSPSVGNINVSGATGSLNLNNNTVTINVSGFPLKASTNTLMTVEGTLYGSANATPAFTGQGLATGYGAMVVTTPGSLGEIEIVVTNTLSGSEPTTTSLARTVGASPQIYGNTLTFTATVTGAATTPSGNVIFKDGSLILATVALTSGTPPSSTATYISYTDLKVPGSPHSIVAYYSGDSTHSFSDSSASPISQTITAKALTVLGVGAGSVTYDGTTIAQLSGPAYLQSAESPGTGSPTDGSPYIGDAISVGTVTGTLAAKDVGSQPVTNINVPLSGPGSGNYTATPPASLVQAVTPKTLTVTGLAVTNKLADGTTVAGFTTNSLAVLITPEAGGSGSVNDGAPYTGDSVNLTGTPVGSFPQTNAEANLTVTVTGLSLTGTSIGDYTLTEPVFTASIIGPPGDQIRANNSGFSLDTGYSWVSGTQPDSTNWAIWTGTYDSANLTNDIATSVTWGGIMVSNVTGGTVDVTGFITLTLNQILGGDGGIDIVGTNDLTLDLSRMNLSANQSWNVASGRTFTWAANTSPYAFNLNNGGDYNLTLNGGGNYVFDGNLYDDPKEGIVAMSGTGAYMFANANYVNHWTLNSGTLDFENSYAISGNTGSALTINGGTIDNTSGGGIDLGNNPSFNWNGDFTFAGSADMDLGAGPVTLGKNVQVSVGAGTLTVDGTVGDQGQNYSLTLDGAGTLSLTGPNTYGGNTTVDGGTLAIAQATLATNSTITVATGAVLELDFTVTNTIASLVLDGVVQAAGVYNNGNSSSYLTGTGSLLVTGFVAPQKTNITYTVSGNQLVLNWPNGQGWQLQEQTNSLSTGLSTNWFNVSGATPPYTNIVNPVNSTVFFRLVSP